MQHIFCPHFSLYWLVGSDSKMHILYKTLHIHNMLRWTLEENHNL